MKRPGEWLKPGEGLEKKEPPENPPRSTREGGSQKEQTAQTDHRMSMIKTESLEDKIETSPESSGTSGRGRVPK